jgi:hypothetical protein
MSLITSVIGGITGAHAAGQAANAQVGAAQEAAGTVQGAAAAGNTGIQSATTAGQGQVLAAGQTAGQGVTLASILASLGVTQAAGAGQANLNPYASAGAGAATQLQAGLAPGGDLSKQFSGVDLQNDPGYQFRLQQGQIALQRQQAAMGSVSGGGALKQLNDYAQGSASSEYQNAFNRFQTAQQNAVGNLQGTANAGQAAATTQGAFGLQGATTAAGLGLAGSEYAGNADLSTNQYASTLGFTGAEQQAANSNAAAKYAGDTQLDAGNARAAGIMGKQNAYNGIYSAAGSALNGGVNTYNNGNSKSYSGDLGASLGAIFGMVI